MVGLGAVSELSAPAAAVGDPPVPTPSLLPSSRRLSLPVPVDPVAPAPAARRQSPPAGHPRAMGEREGRPGFARLWDPSRPLADRFGLLNFWVGGGGAAADVLRMFRSAPIRSDVEL